MHVGESFFFYFFVDNFLLFARMHATKNASFFWRVWYAPKQDSTPQETEIDYGDNKESYDKRDGEGD